MHSALAWVYSIWGNNMALTIGPDRIFIWKSYGDVKVYLIDSEEALTKLRQEIYEACKFLDESPNDFMLQGVDKMIQLVGGVGCHETFEYGTGFSTLRRLK